MMGSKNYVVSFLLLVGLAYVFLIAAPVSFLVVNSEAMQLNYSDIMYLAKNFIFTVPVAALAALLIRKMPRFNGVLYILISVVLVISLIIPNKTGALDGIRDSAVFAFSYDSFLHAGKFFLLFVLFSFLYKKQQANIKLISLLLLMASLVQVLYLIFDMQEVKGSNNDMHLASLSTQENIIIIGLDGIQGDVVEDIIYKHPELVEGLSGFKFYPNVSSGAPNTERSNFITMLGKVPPLESTTKKWLSKYSKNLMPNVLSEQAGYESTTYNTGVPCHTYNLKWECFGQGAFFKQYGDFGEGVSKKGIYLYSMMRFMPAFLSQAIYQSVFGYLTNAKTSFALASNDIGKHRFGRSYFELLTFIDNLEVIEKAPSFLFHHYVFTHQPSNFDEECNYRSSNTVKQDIYAAQAEAKCALQMMDLVVDKLKKINGYDNSIVIFMSDHGLEANMNETPVNKGDFIYRGNMVNFKGHPSVSRYDPILFYKDFSSRGEMEIVTDNVSLVDIFPTICKRLHIQEYCLNLDHDGIDLDSSHVKRTKKALMYIGGSENVSEHYFKNLELFEIVSFSGDLRKELQSLFKSTYPGTYSFSPSDLHHQVGILNSSSIRVDSKSSKSGFLSFGPYLMLPKGKYSITIQYDSSVSNDEKVGWWDIVGDVGKTNFFKGNVYGSDGKRAKLNTTFYGDGQTRFEFRLYFSGVGDLQLYDIQVDKVNE